jgi:NADH-quinone oxidoreductase subunit H
LVTIVSPAVSEYYYNFYPFLSGIFGPGPAQYVALACALIVFAILLVVIVLGFSYVLGWLERKMIARVQSRRGPTYVGKFGILQNLADLIKLLSKENIIPKKADKAIFLLALPSLIVLTFLAIAFIPLNSVFVGITSGLGLIAVFMLLSFSPLFIFLSGWASGNKFGSIGSQRSVVMILSYEIPLLLVVAAVAMMANSFNLFDIVAAQSNGWFILLMPIGFVLFMIIMLAELERPPFDLREADNELIAGWLTEPSSPYYALALLLDYLRMFFGTALITLLFLGGWLGPSIIPQLGWFIIKMFAVGALIIMIRAFMMRMRIDKLLQTGWLYLLPLAILNLVVSFILFIK